MVEKIWTWWRKMKLWNFLWELGHRFCSSSSFFWLFFNVFIGFDTRRPLRVFFFFFFSVYFYVVWVSPYILEVMQCLRPQGFEIMWWSVISFEHIFWFLVVCRICLTSLHYIFSEQQALIVLIWLALDRMFLILSKSYKEEYHIVIISRN